MTSYRRSAPLPHLSCAGESGGAYGAGGADGADGADGQFDPDGALVPDAVFDPDDPGPARDPDDPGPAAGSPLPRLVERMDALERAKRDVLDTFRDVAAWGGTAQTTGYTQGEYLTLVGRLPARETWRFDLLVRRLPACPVTAVLLERGQITVDQAVSIVAGTTRLSGDTLTDVEAAAAHAALERNRRGDDPDIDADVETLVQRTRTGADQDRRDRGRLERNSVRVQPDLFGAGRITEDWADPEGFQTRLAAIEHAAGPPTPDSPRGTQLAEGSLATARAWLAGRTTHPTVTAADAVDVDGWLPDWAEQPDLPTGADQVDLGPSSARPTLVVRIDIADLQGIDPDDPDTLRWLASGSDAAFGRLVAAGRLSSTPWLGRQLLDTLACNADLLVAVVDGQRPLAEFRRTRGLPDRIRRQVLWRDLGCRWPSCRAPIAHCDVHHLDEDPTNHQVDNLLTLCRRHHRRLHSVFWHPRLDGTTGQFDLLRTPDGNPVHTTYPRGTPPQLTARATPQLTARATPAAPAATATNSPSGSDPPEVP